MLFSNLAIMLVLQLLRKWPIAQLSVLTTLNFITIVMSIPPDVYKTTANKISAIGTELGFILLNILLLVMYLLENSENSNTYNARLGLSWTAVALNIMIFLMQIVVRIAEFIRLRRQKAREQMAIQNTSKRSQGPENSVIGTNINQNDSQIVKLRRRKRESEFFEGKSVSNESVVQMSCSGSQKNMGGQIHLPGISRLRLSHRSKKQNY